MRGSAGSCRLGHLRTKEQRPRHIAPAADPTLARYDHLLDDLQRRRPHVRSVEVEELLAQGADVARAASDAFTALDNADLDFGRVRDETGEEVTLTKGRYALLLESKERSVRRAAFETLAERRVVGKTIIRPDLWA